MKFIGLKIIWGVVEIPDLPKRLISFCQRHDVTITATLEVSDYGDNFAEYWELWINFNYSPKENLDEILSKFSDYDDTPYWESDSSDGYAMGLHWIQEMNTKYPNVFVETVSDEKLLQHPVVFPQPKEKKNV